MVAVLPNVRHTIASDYRSVLSIVIEPESVRPGVLEDFANRLSGPEGAAFANRIRAAYLELREHQGGNDFSSAEFDIAVPWRSACRSACSIRAWRARSCRSENSPASR